jgi:hypothetical protein
VDETKSRELDSSKSIGLHHLHRAIDRFQANLQHYCNASLADQMRRVEGDNEAGEGSALEVLNSLIN